MNEPRSASPATSDQSSASEGQRRFARNVLSNWAAQFILIAVGFIIPRLIDTHLGQERLGIWDFGWSLTSYLMLLALGVQSAVNRYVARHRALLQWDELNAVASSCMLVFVVASGIIALATVVMVWAVPAMLSLSDPGMIRDARWLLAMLGAARVLEMLCSVYIGVLTGSHRYDLHSMVEGSGHVVRLGGLMTVCLRGGGLIWLGVVVLAVDAAASLVKYFLAFRVCPTLSLSHRRISKAHLRDVFAFGTKTFLGDAATILLYQTNKVLVGVFLGAAAVAQYSRPNALVMHAVMFLRQYGRVIAPSASALQAQGDSEALSALMVQTTKLCTLMAMPIILGLVILGSPLLRVWMGDQYDEGLVLMILAVGHVGYLSQIAGFQVLVGTNRHGLPVLSLFIAAVISGPLTFLVLKLAGGGLVSVAVCLAVTLTVVYNVVIPIITSHALNVTIRRYLLGPWVYSTVMSLPFAMTMLAARYWAGDDAKLALGVGVLGGGLVLSVTYWLFVIPPDLKRRLLSRIPWPGRSPRAQDSDG